MTQVIASAQKRVFLWAVPRSISTAFFRAMMNKSNTKVLLEPFSRAYYFGPERVSERYAEQAPEEGCTFGDVKRDCESDHPGYEMVFAKDMAYYLSGRLATTEFLPKGFTHTFLLRDPRKSAYSLYKMSLNKDLTGWNHFDANEIGFKELYELFELVTKTLGEEAVIIDADDLLKNPESMMRLYCAKVGVSFEAAMLNWDECPTHLKVFEAWMPWFEGVLTSRTFQPSATKPVSPSVLPALPRHVQKAVDDSMPYYESMHALRLRPNSLLTQ